jgi:hypothetical protein
VVADFRGQRRGANRAPSGSSLSGSSDFLRLSKALKNAGRTELRKELHKGLKDGAKPLLKVAREAARESFPEREGLAAREAKTRFRVQVRTGTQAGVQVVADGRYVNVKLLNNRGIIRHPVFADPKKTRREWTWVDQPDPNRGWFDKAMQDHVDQVKPELEQAIQRVVDKIAREA